LKCAKCIYCSTTRVSSQGNHFGHHLSRLKRYSQARLAQLYQLRWQATEVNFKHLKTTLKMEMIFAKTPEMVHKEIWVHLLAYNLLRNLMWQSAQQARCRPRISLQGTRQQFNQFRPIWLRQLPKPSSPLHYPARCHQCSPRSLPHRAEPRVTKRRPKSFPRMQQPRSVLKAKLTA